MLADLCPCFHRSATKLCPDLVSFACWIVTEFWSFTHKSDLVIHALNRARFCVICALNYAQILVVRALDCAHVFCTLPLSQSSCNTGHLEWQSTTEYSHQNLESSRVLSRVSSARVRVEYRVTSENFDRLDPPLKILSRVSSHLENVQSSLESPLVSHKGRHVESL